MNLSWKPWFVFTVLGTPIGKGSFRAVQRKGSKFAQLINANPKTKQWQHSVCKAAQSYGISPLECPFRLALVFRVARPKGHFSTSKRLCCWTLLPSAPGLPTVRGGGDVDKFGRTILDALEGVAYDNDSRVVSLACDKIYADQHNPPGVHISGYIPRSFTIPA